MTELHQKYAPILRYTKGEHFFPMRVDDVLKYSGLHIKNQNAPLIPPGQVMPDHLAKYAQSPEVFLRSVEPGPRTGQEVVAGWSQAALEMVYRWSTQTASSWREELARRAYSWFNPKTMAATHLFWWNDLIAPLLDGALENASPEELPRLILPTNTRDLAVDKYQGHKSPYTYYYRQVRDGPYLCLQYWFFYSYNDWGRSFSGMNDHEADWENMMIFFRLDGQGRPQEPPAYVTFVGHHSRLTKPWAHPDVDKVGTHPIGYVAAGSHATYPEAKPYSLMELYKLVDYATGDGVTIDHDDWVHRIALETVPWLPAYRGSWGTRFWLPLEQTHRLLKLASVATPIGFWVARTWTPEIELPGVSAPHGPMIGDTGDERPQWAGPVAWAGVPGADIPG
ncbi:MAG: hypothetical protein JXM69_12750 [Anaerolineae bacterium]|nr:hypothetical protein [Anaerolineae bacterium]